VRGTIQDATGHPLRAGQVFLCGGDHGEHHLPGTPNGEALDATGGFAIIGAPAGRYVLWIRPSGAAVRGVWVTLPPEQVLTLRLRIDTLQTAQALASSPAYAGAPDMCIRPCRDCA